MIVNPGFVNIGIGQASKASAPAELPLAADTVSLGGPRDAAPKRPQPQPSTVEQLLRDMKPFIRDVHVVRPGADDAPPILGGSGVGAKVPLPEELAEFPSQRWVVTPEIEAFHREHYGGIPTAELRAEDQGELEPTAFPLLQRRYGDREGMTVVELGPATSSVVPRALGESLHRYFGTDLSVPLMDRQRDVLNEPGFQIAGAYQVQGDTYDLPYESGVADVLFTSCHPPFVSSSPGERIQAFGEAARVLKEGGEFVLFPWTGQGEHPAVKAFIDKHFEVVDRQVSFYGADRQMVVFRKKA